MKPDHVGATGILAMYVPPGEHRDLLLDKVRRGERFIPKGRGRGFLWSRVYAHVQTVGLESTFESLLMALEAEASKHEKAYSSIENVIRRGDDSRVIYYERGKQIESGFPNLRTQLSKARQIFREEHSGKSVTPEKPR